MLSVDDITKQFRPYQARASKELYLDAQHALDFVRTCDANAIAVIGIEGFTLSGGKIIPRLDMIADFSSATAADWPTYQAMCNRAAIAFLTNALTEPDIVFTFELLPAAEWQPA
jgi:hypothetical protein